ncbi:MAG: ATP-binding cassette domain-containing protein, partial [Chitinophagaceae bacterium]
MLAGFQNITFEFGARTIVENATWHIQPNERIGLIGYNGTGKSTLLKVLVGEYSPSAGSVERGRETTIGYLHQDLLSFDTNESILEVAMGAFEKVRQLEKEIEELGKILETNEDEKLLIEYSEKLHELDTLDGYTIQHRTEEVLQGLGFNNADLNRPYKEFSGGWRMRVLLTKMILAQPDLLLLDEPTNHLDLPSIEWLEKYLQHYQGAVVIVSHDKYFLNRMVTKIVELYQKELHIYSGNYDYYETEKAIRIDMQQKAYENQQDYIRQNERLIERFRAKASKAAMAQSLMKKLDKIDRIEEASIERPNLKINFRVDKTPGKVLVELNHLTKKFGDQVILDNAKAEIERGDKIALIGANGKGKSTLLRIIADVESYMGERKWGHNVDESFYAQHQLESLDLNNTILDEMRSCGSQMTDAELRSLLGCFLFTGDDSDKKIKILSGGEKARVALAKTIISRANFLMLDEPTNHLDMHSCDLLIEALKKYEGSIILVSHDRHFIAKTANKIWEIVDHQIKEFKGTYDEWIAWNQRMEQQALLLEKSEKQKTKEQNKPEKKQEPVKVEIPVAKNVPINKEHKKELQRKQKQFQQLEEEISKEKSLLHEIEKQLSHPETYADKNKFQKTEQEYKSKNSLVLDLEKKYEILFNE